MGLNVASNIGNDRNDVILNDTIMNNSEWIEKRKELYLKNMNTSNKWNFNPDINQFCLFIYLGLRFPELNVEGYGLIETLENETLISNFIEIIQEKKDGNINITILKSELLIQLLFKLSKKTCKNKPCFSVIGLKTIYKGFDDKLDDNFKCNNFLIVNHQTSMIEYIQPFGFDLGEDLITSDICKSLAEIFYGTYTVVYYRKYDLLFLENLIEWNQKIDNFARFYLPSIVYLHLKLLLPSFSFEEIINFAKSNQESLKILFTDYLSFLNIYCQMSKDLLISYDKTSKKDQNMEIEINNNLKDLIICSNNICYKIKRMETILNNFTTIDIEKKWNDIKNFQTDLIFFIQDDTVMPL